MNDVRTRLPAGLRTAVMAALLTLIAATGAALALPATEAWAQEEDDGSPVDGLAPDGGEDDGAEAEDGVEDDGFDDGAEDGFGEDDGFEDGTEDDGFGEDDGFDDGVEDDGFDDDAEVLDESFESDDTGAPVGGVDAGFGGAAGAENGLIALAAALLAAAGGSHLWYRRSALQA